MALRVAVVGLLAVFSACGLAVEGALSAPGDDPAVAKLAEWGRDNGLGGLVTWLEGLRYAADQPASAAPRRAVSRRRVAPSSPAVRSAAATPR